MSSLYSGGSNYIGLFTHTEEDLDEDDEYEFYEVGALLIGKLAEGEFKVEAGVAL